MRIGQIMTAPRAMLRMVVSREVESDDDGVVGVVVDIFVCVWGGVLEI